MMTTKNKGLNIICVQKFRVLGIVVVGSRVFECKQGLPFGVRRGLQDIEQA